MNSQHAMRQIQITRDVPTELKIGKRSLYLDKYIKQKLRDELGMPNDFNQEAKQAIHDAFDLPLSALQKNAHDAKNYLSKKEIYNQQTIQKNKKPGR